MKFEYPKVLWLLALAVPALAGFFVWSWRKRCWLISQFVQSRLLANLTVGVSVARQKVRMVLLLVSIALLVVVVARPQWGFSWEEARQRGLDIVIAIDTSKSMMADDIAPNRLARAKLSALDLKRLAKGDRMGLVAFAGTAFLQCPLSVDEEAFRQSLNALDVNIIPQGGTALAEAIQTARSAFKEKNEKVLVLFTDGEDHDGSAVDAAREAAKEGMRIYTVGVGSPSGEMLRSTDARGRSDFVRDENGNAVMSRLNEKLLGDIAQAAGGFYLQLSGAETMEMLYDRGLSKLAKSEFAARQVKRWHERYQWFLGVAIALLLTEVLMPERRRVRRSEAILQAPTAESRKGAAVLLLLVLAGSSAWASPGQGFKQYQQGRYDASYAEYQRALEKHPNDPKLNFNAGAAAFQNRNYDSAEHHFTAALLTDDLLLQQQAYYNLGNTHYRKGADEKDPSRKKSVWEQAITGYENTLKLNPKDADAQFNLEWVRKRLDELKKEQEEQKKKQEDRQPSEAARKAKAEADAAVDRREYPRALEIMETQLKQDPTTSYYADYMERLRAINGIEKSAQR